MVSRQHVKIYKEIDNYEGSGIEGEKIWIKLYGTRAGTYDEALDRLIPRIRIHDGSYSDRYLLVWGIRGRDEQPAIDISGAVRMKLFTLYYRKVKIAQLREWVKESMKKHRGIDHDPSKDPRQRLFYYLHTNWKKTDDYPEKLPYPPNFR
jgi:hypothetical protein